MTDAPSATSPVRVFVLDDYEMIRRGLNELLSATDDLVFAGEAASAAEAVRKVDLVRPDVAIFDVVLPDGSGIDVCRDVRARHPEINCLLLTFHDDEEALLASVMAGALGYLTKQIHGAGILHSIRRAARGETLTDPEATRRLLDRLRGVPSTGRPPSVDGGAGHASRSAGLGERERQILDRVADGATNAEIATQLALTETAVRNQVAVIFAKLGLARRVQAAGRGSGQPSA
ncbi:response regulator [uncultured Friedmanniella sp.]|uniref:response regulator n=1 Tax=uncultured Friedmanniella sp. TaxID=335381 RepID=UPI0035C963F5